MSPNYYLQFVKLREVISFEMSTAIPSTNPESSTTSAGIGGSEMSQATTPGASEATAAPGPSNVARSTSSHVSDLRTTKRSKEELRNHGRLFDEDIVKQKYTYRGTKECMQWTLAITQAIPSKFSTVKNDAIEAEQFESIYD